MTLVIDGKNLIMGRVAAFAARKALFGETIAIVNCENIYISGRKDRVKEDYKESYERGNPHAGPFQPKSPERIMRRTVRGMLPYKQERGRLAYARVKCYIGVPVEFKNEKMETLKTTKANISKFATMNYISLDELSKHLGKQ